MSNTTSSSKHWYQLIVIITLIVLVGFVLFFATGCSTKQAEETNPQASQAAEPPSQTPPPANEFLKQFGDTITWEDGVSVSVSTPAEYIPTEYAAGTVEGQPNVAFEIVLTNNTDEPLDPGTWTTASSGGVEASQIFDTGEGAPLGELAMGPSTTLLPGQTVKWYVAYSVADPAEITLEVYPSLTYESGIFTNVPF